MIKLPLILISYIGLFFMGLFNMEEVTVENNLPAAIAPSQKKLIQLTIRKGDIKGFSKLELPMPVGFNIVPEDIKGASFTFKAQSAKFVWMQLPEEANFTITYYIETASTVKGVYDIGGTFSYVKDNRRLDQKLPSRTMVIKPLSEIEEELPQDDVLANSSTTNVNDATAPTADENTSTNLSGLDLPANIKHEAEVVEMICSRAINKISDTEFEVKLTIVNNAITGFGKILETLPEHCKTEKINDAGAVVTQDKNTIKFVWFEIPNSNTIEVSYKVSCLKPLDTPIINGQLSYTDNGNPMVVPIMQGSTTANEVLANNVDTNSNDQTNTTKSTDMNSNDVANNTNTPANASNTSENSTSNTEIKSENNAPKYNNNASNNNQDNNTTAESKPSKTPVTSVPSADKGITYKVQLLAAHRVVNKTYFTQKFNYNNGFNIENHEGWIKYTTGSFAQYKEARDERERITNNHGKLPGPFVTAYNDGARITVQEALLITNQQWYK